jgi:hypothetical protein
MLMNCTKNHDAVGKRWLLSLETFPIVKKQRWILKLSIMATFDLIWPPSDTHAARTILEGLFESTLYKALANGSAGHLLCNGTSASQFLIKLGFEDFLWTTGKTLRESYARKPDSLALQTSPPGYHSPTEEFDSILFRCLCNSWHFSDPCPPAQPPASASSLKPPASASSLQPPASASGLPHFQLSSFPCIRLSIHMVVTWPREGRDKSTWFIWISDLDLDLNFRLIFYWPVPHTHHPASASVSVSWFQPQPHFQSQVKELTAHSSRKAQNLKLHPLI